MEDVRRTTQLADLCLRIGDVLMSAGSGAADVTVTMQAVADAYGHRNPEIDVTFTSLSISLTHEDSEQPVVLIRQVRRRSLDYDILTQVDRFVRELLHDPMELSEARRRMNQIVSSPRSLPRWAVTLAGGIMCAAVGVALGGRVLVGVAAFVAAVLIERTQAWLTTHRLPNFYQQVCGGAIATLIAIALKYASVETTASLVVTANIVMLLAGIGFMGALQDALSGFYLTAAARIIEAMLSTAGIIAGVGAGLMVGDLVGVDLGILVPGFSGWASVPVLVCGGAVSAAAFAASCRAPKRSWVPIALVSGVASVIVHVVELNDLGRTAATGAAAFFIGLVAYGVSGRFRIPPLIIAVCSIVPFLPGLSIYRGLSLLSAGGSGTLPGILAMMTAISVAVALASGVILGEYVAQPVKQEARRLEDRLAGPRMVGALRARASKRDRNHEGGPPGAG